MDAFLPDGGVVIYSLPPNGVVTVIAKSGTAGKTASLKIEVKSGSKQRFLTVPLEIV